VRETYCALEEDWFHPFIIIFHRSPENKRSVEKFVSLTIPLPAFTLSRSVPYEGCSFFILFYTSWDQGPFFPPPPPPNGSCDHSPCNFPIQPSLFLNQHIVTVKMEAACASKMYMSYCAFCIISIFCGFMHNFLKHNCLIIILFHYWFCTFWFNLQTLQ
jgi:hypothetical protein